MAELGRFGLEEFAARGRIEIEVRHGDRGALTPRGRFYVARLAAFAAQNAAVRGLARAARNRKACHGSDGGERLAAESHRRYRLQVVEARDLAGGMPGERER